MVHLTNEALSELLDGAQVVGAEKHLSDCPVCRGELEVMRQLRSELRELPQLDPPPELWTAIAARLPGGAPARRFKLGWPKLVALQAAAMAAVFVIGLGLGRFIQPDEGATESVPVSGLVAQTPTGPQLPPASLTDALAEVQRLGVQYDVALRNLERMAAEQGAETPSLAAERLASLNALVEASRTALAVNPADEALNAYLFSALQERDAVMRQINAQGTSSQNRWR
jgi:hypothetical protein